MRFDHACVICLVKGIKLKIKTFVSIYMNLAQHRITCIIRKII